MLSKTNRINAANDRPRVLYLGTEDRTFLSHRLPVAQAMLAQGAEVYVMTRDNGGREEIERLGFRVIPWRVSRGSLNPFRELISFVGVLHVYQRIKPDLVHHVALKPIAYGGLAARLCGDVPAVNAITGLGHGFHSESISMRLVRWIWLRLLRVILRNTNAVTVFQNPENRDALMKSGAFGDGQCVTVIRGSGVDAQKFAPVPEPAEPPVVLLPARFLWAKGVAEFVEAARILRNRNLGARFVLAGSCDPANPDSIPERQISAWQSERVVEIIPWQKDMPGLLGSCHMIAYPTYHEGLPKTLLEASSCSRAIVTTDVPGAREVVRHGYNGLLVPPKDPLALANAIEQLIQNPKLRRDMGRSGRERIKREFSNEVVVAQTVDIYTSLLNQNKPSISKAAYV